MSPQVDPTPVPREQWPYSPGTYLLRACWRLAWFTVWHMTYWRIPGIRSTILRIFGARVGRGTSLRASTWVQMPWQLRLGERCLIGSGVNIYNLGEITIGDDTVVSQGAHLCAGTHDYTDHRFRLIRAPITIGDDVWVGADAFIGPNVKIGRLSVVGARSSVYRDLPEAKVCVGNPARPIKDRELR